MSSFDDSAKRSALTGAGATIDDNFDHEYVGMYKIDIDEADTEVYHRTRGYVALEKRKSTKQTQHL